MNVIRRMLVARRARAVLSSLGILFPPVDAQAVARALGYNVLFADFDDKGERWIADMRGFSDAAARTIYVRRDMSVADKQMAIATELGKALLHPAWWNDETAYRANLLVGAKSREEENADWFAISLLAPKRWIDSIKAYASHDDLQRVFVLDAHRMYRARRGY